MLRQIAAGSYPSLQAIRTADTFGGRDSTNALGQMDSGQVWTPSGGVFGIASSKAKLVTGGAQAVARAQGLHQSFNPANHALRRDSLPT
jgi:hypothetical protein